MFLNLLPGLETDFAEEIVCWRVDGLLAETGDWELGPDGSTARRDEDNYPVPKAEAVRLGRIKKRQDQTG